jgi:hypothetical protein
VLAAKRCRGGSPSRQQPAAHLDQQWFGRIVAARRDDALRKRFFRKLNSNTTGYTDYLRDLPKYQLAPRALILSCEGMSLSFKKAG